MRKAGKILGWVALSFTVLTVVNFLPMLRLTVPGMEKYELSGITTHVRPQDLASARRIAQRISDQAVPVTGRLGSGVQDDISLIVYPGRKWLHIKTIGFAGVLLPDWYIGKNTRNNVLITSSDNPGPQHSRDSIERASVHEYVHVLTDRRNKAMDYWLKEGFALYLAGQEPSQGAVRGRMDITLDEFSTHNAIRFAEVGGYTIAYVFVDYLQQEYGWDQLLKFLNPGTDFTSVTGKTREELLDGMKEWLVLRNSA